MWPVFLRLTRALLLVALASTAWVESVAQQSFRLPSLPAATLEQSFPKYTQISSDSMVRYKQDLELFRVSYLEGYNRALIAHAKSVDESSRELERTRAAGRISREDYEFNHRYLREELTKLGARGEYMQLYYQYLKLYRSRMQFADKKLAELQDVRRRGGYQM